MDELFRDPNIEHPNRSHRVIIFRVFLVLAIGATNIQQIEDGAAWSTSTTFYHRALQELDTVLEREDIECVQNLLLLSIFTTFNVEGPSIWATLGFAIRLAVGLGLHRRVGPEKGSPAELERRRRTWWSLYNFDRVVAFTLGRPLSIADEDIDIEVSSIWFNRCYANDYPSYHPWTPITIQETPRSCTILSISFGSVACSGSSCAMSTACHLIQPQTSNDKAFSKTYIIRSIIGIDLRQCLCQTPSHHPAEDSPTRFILVWPTTSQYVRSTGRLL